MISEETHYRLLKLLESDPEISQRELARQLDISLGKTNYCLKALMERGLVKVENFRNSRHKLAYAYVLTPKGIRSKAEITMAFLRQRQKEYESLEREIAELRDEVRSLSLATTDAKQ